ncbi:MAG: helix-turn-helix transcriptional regulator [bacterium]|nr:helix-turn-helix transcriptional regulator [bacterium]
MLDLLSAREMEVLKLIACGKSREEISLEMEISKLTYDSYRKAIRNKLQIKSQADWAKIIMQMNSKELY